MAEESALFWVDVVGCAINRLSLIDGSIRRWSVPEMISFLVPRDQGGSFVAGMRSGFYTVTLDPFERTLIGNPEPDLPENRLNDGKADFLGHLWAGTMRMSGDRPTGALYRLDPDHRWYRMDADYYVTNGPAFSPVWKGAENGTLFQNIKPSAIYKEYRTITGFRSARIGTPGQVKLRAKFKSLA